MINKYLYILIALVIFSNLLCSKNQVAGSSTEDGNAQAITGVIVNESGTQIPDAIVRLIPQDYSPILDGEIPDSLETVTDSNGKYSFTSVSENTYNLLVYNKIKNKGILKYSILIDADSIDIGTDTLQELGSINILLNSKYKNEQGVEIPGTNLFKKIPVGTEAVDIHCVPSGTIKCIRYVKKEITDSIKVIAKNFTVFQEDTVIIDKQHYWAKHIDEGSFLESNSIEAIAIDENNTKWISIENYGIFTLDENYQWKEYGYENLPHLPVTCITIDSENNKWFAATEVLSKYDGNNWTYFDSTDCQWLGYGIKSVTIDNNGTVWITGNNCIIKYGNNNWDIIYGNFQPSGATVVERDQTVWIGTVGSGIKRYRDLNYTDFTKDNSKVPDDSITCALIDLDGNIWFGTKHGIVRYNGIEWKNFNDTENGILNNEIFAMAYSNSEEMWFCIKNGIIAKYSNKKWNIYHFPESLNTSVSKIKGIVIDDNDKKWIGTCNTNKNRVIEFEAVLQNR